MANSKTSLNGYEYGRNPKTTAPFWAGSGEGAEIDDTGTYTDKTWSSQKISDELDEKADADDVYTKSQVDEMIADIPAVDAYTKTETDDLLAEKANAADVYTKSQVDNLIPDVSGLATKTELNTGLDSKVDVTDLAGYAKVTSVYTKTQTYTKEEVDDLIEGATPAPVDAYTKAQTDDLLLNYAKVTSVYTKAQTYTKDEVDDLIEGATPAPVDAYTKAQTDTLLADKANVADVYTKTQTDNLLADKADATDLANYATATSVYTKAQTYTKAEVNDLISQAGGGGAEIDDTSVAANRVWSSDKTRAELLKASGLRYTSYISTNMSLIRAKIAGSNSNTQNAMTEQFSADYQYSLTGATLSVTIMYADGSSGQTATINLTDIPWNDLASAEYTSNYPDDNARWKRIVASEDIFEVCIAGNVSGTSGYYYPYIFVRVPKGTYTASISLSTNLKYAKWTKAGSVSVINGYATDPTVPIYNYDATSAVSTDSAQTILSNAFSALAIAFRRRPSEIHKINKFVIQATKTDMNGNSYIHRAIWNIKSMQTVLPNSSSQNVTLKNVVAECDDGDTTKWVYTQPYSTGGILYKITENIPSSSGNITAFKVSDSTTMIDTVLFGYSETWSKWYIKFYV